MQRLNPAHDWIIRQVIEKTRLHGADAEILAELKARWASKVVGMNTELAGTADVKDGLVIAEVSSVSRKGEKWKMKMLGGVVQIDGGEFLFAKGGGVLEVDLCDG
jgi:hypothetical protein